MRLLPRPENRWWDPQHWHWISQEQHGRRWPRHCQRCFSEVQLWTTLVIQDGFNSGLMGPITPSCTSSETPSRYCFMDCPRWQRHDEHLPALCRRTKHFCWHPCLRIRSHSIKDRFRPEQTPRKHSPARIGSHPEQTCLRLSHEVRLSHETWTG